MVEMERKVTKAWSVPPDHVVRKETQGKTVQTLTTETGNSVRDIGLIKVGIDVMCHS